MGGGGEMEGKNENQKSINKEGERRRGEMERGIK